MISGSDGIALIMLAISGAVRSNGAVNAGYICFVALHRASGKRNFYVGLRGDLRCCFFFFGVFF